MTSSPLWLVNTNGNVFTLSTKQRCFRQLVKTYADGIRLKRLAACEDGAWGIGHDHQVYLFVYNTEVPIRVQETTFENQRWTPISGFSGSSLLPTDRRNWSDEHGYGFQPKENYELPSSNWRWDGDWEIDDNLCGQIVSREGWQYATNFTSVWTPESRWKSCVRKRKWIRFRRFIATNSWAHIFNHKLTKSGDCFIDIAVGGFDIPSQAKGHLCVWGVTNTGQVYARVDVTQECPEGKEWRPISTESVGLINISVGPTGLVWGVTWDGQALVRIGVDREHVYGTGWRLVSYPEPSTRIMQVAVGLNTLWALSRDGKIWYRKGIQGTQLLTGTMAAVGTTWVEMVGEMSHVAVTPNDQVFAIGLDNEKEIYFRAGVTSNDLGGKTWQLLSLRETSTLVEQDSICSGSMSNSLTESEFEDFDMLSDSGSQISQTNPGHSSGLKVGSPGEGLVLVTQIVDESGDNDAVKSMSVADGNVEECEASQCGQMTLATRTTTGENNFKSKIAVAPVELVEGKPKQDTHLETLPVDNLPCICDNNDVGHDNNDVGHDNNDVGHVSSASEVNVTVTADDTEVNVTVTEDILQDHDIKEKEAVLTSNQNIPEHLAASSCNFDSLGSSVTSENTMFNFVTDLISGTSATEDGGSRSDKEAVTEGTSTNNNSNPSVNRPVILPVDVAAGEGSRGVAKKSASQITKESLDSDSMESPKSPSSQTSDGSKTVPWTTMKTSTAVSGTIPSISPLSDQEVIPMFEMTPAMPRFCWAWLSGMACMLGDPAKVTWLKDRQDTDGTNQNENRAQVKISLTLRDEILKKLKARNVKEIESFQYIESAIQRTSWLKKGAMQWYMYRPRPQWLSVSVEMEHGQENTEGGTITLHYSYRGKQMHSQQLISDITCVKRVCDASERTAFNVYTADTTKSLLPWLLRPTSESETEDWMSLLCTVNAATTKLTCPRAAGSIWSTTSRGDVFIHPPDKVHVKGYQMHWVQYGGHLKVVESSPCGITLGIGYNHIVWVHTGGYGGGIFKATSHMSRDVSPQSDVRTVSVFELQKWFPVLGYCQRGFLQDGVRQDSKEGVKLPSGRWQWVTDWTVDYNIDQGVDNSGWQYAHNFQKPFHQGKGIRDGVRRRQWIRRCQLETLGPWTPMSSVPLLDVSVQVDPVTSVSQPIVIWGVGTNGNVLTRHGVSVNNPQGDSWINVAADQPFQSVSVGGTYRVWALARDGSALYRTGVTPYNIAGTVWLQVVPPPPAGCRLTQISVGKTAVWAVDSKGNLWHRDEITETFPEGTRWAFVANNVKSVSVGPQDQVWIVSESNFMKNKRKAGVLYQRVGISESTPCGTNWEAIIGCGWKHVSVRGQLELADEMGENRKPGIQESYTVLVKSPLMSP